MGMASDQFKPMASSSKLNPDSVKMPPIAAPTWYNEEVDAIMRADPPALGKQVLDLRKANRFLFSILIFYVVLGESNEQFANIHSVTLPSHTQVNPKEDKKTKKKKGPKKTKKADSKKKASFRRTKRRSAEVHDPAAPAPASSSAPAEADGPADGSDDDGSDSCFGMGGGRLRNSYKGCLSRLFISYIVSFKATTGFVLTVCF